MSSVGNRQRGVTLIEMMVVVAVIGIIVAVTAPAISAGLDSVRLSTATNSVASFVNTAVTKAERKQQAVELVITAGGIKFYSVEPGSDRELKLPEGVRIETVLPKTEEEERRLILLPGAAIPGIGIQLVNARGARRIVRLDPMTGFPHIESVHAE
jgi:prepilin-type N-terminal cleavage/methylation domain-containing protein